MGGVFSSNTILYFPSRRPILGPKTLGCLVFSCSTERGPVSLTASVAHCKDWGISGVWLAELVIVEIQEWSDLVRIDKFAI